ncbi:DUF460 domain-containing protein [Ignicoccus islandicus]|nr:DUF460 domain-containing protein [Ignicoccus islandicus]
MKYLKPYVANVPTKLNACEGLKVLDCPVMGIDLEPGSPPGLNGSFAVTLVDCNGEVVLSKRSVPLRKLLRYAWEYKPKVLALDNVMELGSNKSELYKVLNLLPVETEVVQVTKTQDGGFIDLKKLAEAMNFNVPQRKLDPSETSYLLALLAMKGLGAKVRSFENKTKVIVTKKRTPRAGGSSMNRFLRAVRNAVEETIREIRASLEEAGLDYDLFVDKSDGAIKRAVFTVYAPRERIRGVVKPFETDAVRVSVKPVLSREINFAFSEEKYLIVGYDPGIKSGLAVLDLNGEPILITSSSELDREYVISILMSLGTPIMVASDTNPPPHSVKKLASKLNAVLFVPRTSMSVSEKEQLAKEIERKYAVKVEDSHQRDALASAYKAYLSIKDKLNELDSYLDKIELEVNKEKVKALVVKGRSLAEVLEEELQKLLDEGNQLIQEVQERKQTPTEAKDDLKTKFLEAEVSYLRSKLTELDEELKRKELELDLLKKSSSDYYELQLRSLKETLSSLNKRLEEYKLRTSELEAKMEAVERSLKNLEDGLLTVGLKIGKLKFNTELKDLMEMGVEDYKVLEADEIEDVNDEVIEYILSSGKILVARSVSEKTEMELRKRGLPVLKEEPVLSLKKVSLYPSDLTEKWREKMEELSEEMDEEDLEELIMSYRSARWS